MARTGRLLYRQCWPPFCYLRDLVGWLIIPIWPYSLKRFLSRTAAFFSLVVFVMAFFTLNIFPACLSILFTGAVIGTNYLLFTFARQQMQTLTTGVTTYLGPGSSPLQHHLFTNLGCSFSFRWHLACLYLDRHWMPASAHCGCKGCRSSKK